MLTDLFEQTISDLNNRKLAIDPLNSYIVQAPAGSGKTEILVQRYLRLLSRVKYPEQIVALTFTRKAAAEMRGRVFLALQEAQNNPDPKKQTNNFAKQALIHSEQQNWQILKQPGRLRITTIDSLCQTLAQAIPQPEEHITYAKISQRPQKYYQIAANLCIEYALTDLNLQPSLRILLLHLDNRHDFLINLFTDLLSNREQWLNNLYLAKEKDKTYYEKMLALMVAHELKRFKEATPIKLRDKLCYLTNLLAQIENDPSSPRYILQDWVNFSEINNKYAAGLASLLLTTQNKLRKSFDHHVGLRRELCEREQLDPKLLETLSDEAMAKAKNNYDAIKILSKILLQELKNAPDFQAALLRLKSLPPLQYDKEQWQVLQALFKLLPILVAQLQLVFNKYNEVDFASITHQALAALGTDEVPTDLALYIDNQIHHLLIDEFQDTSITHFQLLHKLVQGWQPGDGKTLFIVGDPMQSIYRFRQAEVGLFFKATEEGIGAVSLNRLVLSCNFRATPTLVNWVNHRFKNIFSHTNDIESGAVSFCHSEAVNSSNANSYVKAYACEDQNQEALAVAETAREELEEDKEAKVAILVRTRRQLTAIINKLHELQIPFQGVEIESLTNLMHLRDLWSLTKALLFPANRLAWLAVLRSPLGGIELKDLHIIATFAPKKSIYHVLENLDKLTTLSEEAKKRAMFFFSVMHNSLINRWQHEICTWIYQTYKELNGSLIVNESQQKDLEQFWQLLEQFASYGQFPDLEAFEIEFTKLYSQRVTLARLQVMTIHKSKGLEFDAVILPSLSTKAQQNNLPLLRWLKVPRANYEDLLLVSPIKAAEYKQCLLYNYLGKLEAEKESYELQRLLYVAVTRAKKRLYLFDFKMQESHGTLRGLLKDQPFMELHLPAVTASNFLPLLYKLPLFAIDKPLELKIIQPTNNILDDLHSYKRQIGIVAHELLQWINTYHPSTIENLPWEQVKNNFVILGFSKHKQQIAIDLLTLQITKLFADPIGHWLCQPKQEEQNEYELLTEKNGLVKTRIIDRTFLEDNYRWIVDYKTGSADEITEAKYHKQLNEYAKLLAKIYSEPIICGIFYLSNCKWVQWFPDV